MSPTLLFSVTLASLAFASAQAQLTINEILASNAESLADADGDHSDWIEIHNSGPTEINLSGWHLTDQRDNPTLWAFPSRTIPAEGYLIVFASGKDLTSPFATTLHTNFSLSAEGEYLALFEPDGTRADAFDPAFSNQYTDVSYGAWDGGDEYFSPPTPGEPNEAPIQGVLNDVQFSRTRGIADEPFELTLSSDTPDAVIRYTLNGTVPSLFNGIVYSEPILIDKTSTVRANAQKSGWNTSKLTTHTYLFVDDVIDQTVMSRQITEHAVYGPLMRDSLLAQPSISVVGSVGQDISDTIENAVSLEFLPSDGSEGFQINCGIKRVGGHSLNSYPKNNLRLYFRSIHGAGKLRYPLFDGHAYTNVNADEFDQLQLRSGSHDSVFYLGANQQLPSNAQYLRNRWISDMQLLMGHESLRGRWVHVYLNGTYWGHYQLMERATRSFFASYLGGDESDYMATNRGQPVGDSNMQPWADMRAAINDFEAFAQRADLENYVDYMLLNYYAGNDWDWNPEQNWSGGGPLLPEDGGMKFIAWDSDIIFRNLNDNNTAKGGPHSMFHTLMTLPEFKVFVGDRIQKHFYNDGLLTPEKVSEVYQTRAEEIRSSIIAETARWGNGSWTRDQQWQTELNRLTEQFFPQRTEIVLNQFRTRGWTAPLQTPGILPAERVVEPDTSITLTKSPFAIGSIYYTTDGSDPRLPAGSLSPQAVLYTEPIPLNATTHIKTRIHSDTEWSALNEATFYIGARPAQFGDILVSKINFHPAAANAEEEAAGFGRGDFEFIELANITEVALELQHLNFTSGIQYDFSETSLPTLEAGKNALLVSNHAAFTMRYGSGHRILGEFSGSLANEGEDLLIESDEPLLQLRYNRALPWPEQAGGTGPYLVLKDSSAFQNFNDSSNWRLSDSSDTPKPIESTPDTDYIQWASTKIPDPEMRAHLDDADEDGWSNLLEYVFNSDPSLSGSTPAITLERTIVDATPQLIYRLPLRPDADTYEISVETSPNMILWETIPEIDIIEIETLPTSKAFRIRLPEDANSYLRLRITPPS